MANNSVGDINFIDYKQAGADVMFFIFDYRTAAPVLIWMLFPSWNMIYICGVIMIVLGLLNMNGISLNMGVRKLRRIVAGRRVYAKARTRISMIN